MVGMLSTAVDICFGYLYYLRIVCGLVWLRVNRMLFQRPTTQLGAKRWTHHTIAVIGDGFAEGVGDWITCGTVAGLARTLTTALGQTATSVRGVLHHWTVLNLGHLGSSSVEWRPSHPRAPRHFAGRLCCRCSSLPLWQAMEANGAAASAEIVIIVVGSGDFRREEDFANIAGTTVDAVKEMARACKAKGQLVYIVGLAPSGSRDTPPSMHNRARNRLLKAFVREEERLAAAAATADVLLPMGSSGAAAAAVKRESEVGLTAAHKAESLIRWGGSLGAPRLLRREMHTGGGDSVHLNSAGFRVLAGELAQTMMGGLKRIEWLSTARSLHEAHSVDRDQNGKGPW